MQLQANPMNNFGNRGFGGQPQPQRMMNRRGNGGNRGGFRQSRFDNQRQMNQNQGQRPNVQNNSQKQQQQPNNAQKQQPQQQQGQQQNNASPQQQAKPQTQPTVQQQPKPQPQQQQQVKPQQQQQPPQPQQQAVQQQQAQNNTGPKPLMADKIDKPPQIGEQNQQQKNINGGGGFGGNNRGSWGPGNQGPGQGGNRPQGGPGNQGPGQGSNRPQGGPVNQGPGQGGNRPQGGPGNRPFGPRSGGGSQGHGGPGSQGPGSSQGGPARNQRGPNPRGQFNDGKSQGQREEHMLSNKLKELQGPLLDLPPLDHSEVKFNGRSRLYIGNLPNDITEDEIINMFKPFGECAELFHNSEKGFGFIKMDYKVNAEKARRELDGKINKGKPMRVRFAPHNSAIKVINLPPFVSNELLYCAFEIFGKIERAYVKVDDRGKPLGEGVVEYARKPSALAAIRNCSEKCFFLTSSLRPVIVESYDEPDEADGFPEKNIPRKNPDFLRARENGPRFSEPNSFEHEYGTRWKQLHELYKQKEETLKKELAAEEEKLEAQMEYAKYEHETEMLREQLRQREQDRERQQRSWELAERAAETRRDADRAALQRQEMELSQRMRDVDSELRRRQQENTLFVQAQRLNSMLDRQEQGMFGDNNMDGGFNGQRGFDDRQPRWEGPRPGDDFPNKRRRF